jgi:alanyl-tRNA synthetase
MKENYDALNSKVQTLQQEMASLENRDNQVYRSIFEANPLPDSARARLIEEKKEIEKVEAINDDKLGNFKIKQETAIGAGVRRIEAVSGKAAEDFINEQFKLINGIRETLKNPKDITKALENLSSENSALKKNLEKFEIQNVTAIKNDLIKNIETFNGINFIGKIVEASNADSLKKICFSLKNARLPNGQELKDYLIIVAAVIDGKPNVALMIDETLADSKNWGAPKIIKEHIAPLIKGGGGGQKTLATAGGQDATRLNEVIEKVKSLL